jgi:hypothetical protein
MMLRQEGADEHAKQRATEHAREHDRTDSDGTHAGHIFRLYPRVRGVAATRVLAGQAG